MKSIGVVLGLWIAPLLSMGQHGDCKEMLVRAIGAMKQTNSDRLSMEYEIRSKFSNSVNGVVQSKQAISHATLYMDQHKSRLSTSAVDAYKDDSLLVTVMKAEKMIYMTRASDPGGRKIQAQAFGMLQDSLLKKLTITGCETLCDDRDPTLFFEKIDAQLNTPKWKAATGISSVTYWINRRTNLVSRIRVLYDKHPMNINEVDFEVFSYDAHYGGEIFKGTARGMVYTRKGVLLGKYKDFKVYDYR